MLCVETTHHSIEAVSTNPTYPTYLRMNSSTNQRKYCTDLGVAAEQPSQEGTQAQTQTQTTFRMDPMTTIPAEDRVDTVVVVEDISQSSSTTTSMELDPVDAAIMKHSADFPALFDSVSRYFDQRKEHETTVLTGRLAIQLYLSCDYLVLSEYQMLVRKQIEFFEATCDDVDFSSHQGRSKMIALGQVGIRCRHCSPLLPPKDRRRGSVYFPAKLDGIYQASQNMSSIHLCEHCQYIPTDLREELVRLRNSKASGGGKLQWAERAQALGVYEDEYGLRFEQNLGSVSCSMARPNTSSSGSSGSSSK